MRRLAVLGGAPAFAEAVPFVSPAVPPLEAVVEVLRPSYERGVLTNGPLVRALEEQAADRLGVRHVVAVSSCTAGLTLVLRALGPEGGAVMPSFTFCASAHAAMWNACPPVFSECDPATFQVDVSDASQRLETAGVVMGVHVFGAPCAAEELETLGRSAGLPVVFDAAHAFGARRQGRPVGGFGQAEVFSLSPTKPLVAAEGGLVSTDDGALAEAARIGRDYGNPGDYDTRFVGLNARMSELHAAVALGSLARFDHDLARRRAVAARYRQGLAGVPGIAVQGVEPGDESTFKDFTIAVDEQELGLSRDRLAEALSREGVDTRRYFWPPVHRQRAYAGFPPCDLPVTDRTAARVLSLPIFPDLAPDVVDAICDLVGDLHVAAGEVRVAASPSAVGRG